MIYRSVLLVLLASHVHAEPLFQSPLSEPTSRYQTMGVGALAMPRDGGGALIHASNGVGEAPAFGAELAQERMTLEFLDTKMTTSVQGLTAHGSVPITSLGASREPSGLGFVAQRIQQKWDDDSTKEWVRASGILSVGYDRFTVAARYRMTQVDNFNRTEFEPSEREDTESKHRYGNVALTIGTQVQDNLKVIAAYSPKKRSDFDETTRTEERDFATGLVTTSTTTYQAADTEEESMAIATAWSPSQRWTLATGILRGIPNVTKVETENRSETQEFPGQTTFTVGVESNRTSWKPRAGFENTVVGEDITRQRFAIGTDWLVAGLALTADIGYSFIDIDLEGVSETMEMTHYDGSLGLAAQL